MMDDEQPHTIKNTLNKYTIKGMELRKELVSTIMEMMFPKYSNWVTIKWTKIPFIVYLLRVFLIV
jgi:hypothetical protein